MNMFKKILVTSALGLALGGVTQFAQVHPVQAAGQTGYVNVKNGLCAHFYVSIILLIKNASQQSTVQVVSSGVAVLFTPSETNSARIFLASRISLTSSPPILINKRSNFTTFSKAAVFKVIAAIPIGHCMSAAFF